MYKCLKSAVTVGALVIAPAALAAPVTYSGSGIFTQSSFERLVGGNATPIANPFAAPGADLSFSFSITLDPTAPDQDSSPDAGDFEAISGFSVSNSVCSANVGFGAISVEPTGDFVALSGFETGRPSDQLCTAGGLGFSGADLRFQFDPDGLQSDALDPLNWLTDASEIFFTLAFLEFDGVNGFGQPVIRRGIAEGAVTSIDVSAVPLPGAAWMMLSGLGAAGLMRWRQRKP
ncbi:MAG: VPLPA-CTERM sorting domain-containing protein [Pseudomonadota bacterium]